MAASKIMAWSKCAIEIGTTGTNDAMANTFTSVGVVKDKSSTMESADGDTLEMKSTGGETVGYENQEGTVTVTTRVIEPTDSLFSSLLGIGHIVSGEEATDKGELSVESQVVPSEFSLRITPNKVGAKGIKAPKCTVSVKTGWSEEDGNYVDLTFGILHGSQVDGDNKSYWYKKFTSPGVVADTTNGGYKMKES